MIAYTGIETVSNLAEEARDPRRTIPASIRLVAIAVFAIYFTLPLVALSALPVHQDATGRVRHEARPGPADRASRTTRCSGSSRTSDLHGSSLLDAPRSTSASSRRRSSSSRRTPA